MRTYRIVLAVTQEGNLRNRQLYAYCSNRIFSIR
jgi:hypothetical protein